VIFIALHLSKKGPGRPSEARIPRPDYLSSFFGAAAARQRLDALDLFARLLIEGQGRRRERTVETMVSRVLGPGLNGSLRKGDKKADTGSADNHCFEYSHRKKGDSRIRKRSYPARTPSCSTS
jgi:hypothetical protein